MEVLYEGDSGRDDIFDFARSVLTASESEASSSSSEEESSVKSEDKSSESRTEAGTKVAYKDCWVPWAALCG